MIRAIRDIRFYLLLCLPLVWYSCCQLLFGVCSAKKIVVKADPIFGTCFIKEIKNNLNPHYYPKKIGQQITRLWPSVDSICSRLCANKTNLLYLCATPLLCRINDQFVLLENGHVVPSMYYDQNTLHSLTTVMVPTFKNELSLPRIQKFISKLNYSLFDSFTISYQNQNWVQLNQKETNYFSIVCTDQQELNQTIIGQCLHVKNQLEQKEKLHIGNHWIADIRFENQIIVYAKLRGAQHG